MVGCDIVAQIGVMRMLYESDERRIRECGELGLSVVECVARTGYTAPTVRKYLRRMGYDVAGVVKYGDGVRAEAVRMYEVGVEYAEMARVLGVSMGALHGWCVAAGCEMRRSRD